MLVRDAMSHEVLVVGADQTVRDAAAAMIRRHVGAAVVSDDGVPGHGLGFETVGAIASIPEIRELNIGHFLVGEAIFSGLDAAIRRMRALMDDARARADGRNIA